MEEDIKTAFELAMERISRMPVLTPEEISEQKEKEHRPIGEALCHKYLQGSLDDGMLRAELQRYPGDPGKIVRKALESCLLRTISLDNPQVAGKSLEGLCGISNDVNGLRETVQEFWSRMLDDFEQRRTALLRALGQEAKKRLADQGIAGSAVVPNLQEDELSAQQLAELQQSFEPRIAELRALLQPKLNS